MITPGTYNPQDRTPIKKDAVKMCPHCGQVMQAPVKLMRNVMSNYYNKDTKVMVTINDDVDFVEFDGVKLWRVEKMVDGIPITCEGKFLSEEAKKAPTPPLVPPAPPIPKPIAVTK